MGKLFVKNGTPVGSENLCKSCDWGHVMTGYRESDVLVICTNTSPNTRVPFTIYECSGFQDKSKPDWEQMEKLAIEIAPVRVSKKTGGFGLGKCSEPSKPTFDEVAEGEEEWETVEAVAPGFSPNK